MKKNFQPRLHVGRNGVNYNHLEYDTKGYAKVKSYLPRKFDMCTLEIVGEDNTLKGWWTGKGWDGYKVPENARVIRWKREEEDGESYRR